MTHPKLREGRFMKTAVTFHETMDGADRLIGTR